MKWVQDDGGRAAAGLRGHAGDCVARAVAIASGKPYPEIYAALADGCGNERAPKHGRAKGRSARNGVHVTRKWYKNYMRSLGFEWTPTMHIGSGCKVHLADGELPPGRLVVQLSKHSTAVIDGVIHDTYDPQWSSVTNMVRDPASPTGWRTLNPPRVSQRCVYGYWRLADGR